MAYRKDYGWQKKERPRRHWRRWLAAVLVGLCISPEIRNTAAELLIPGDRQLTGQALETMAARLREGEPLGQAAEAFCLEILRHGG